MTIEVKESEPLCWICGAPADSREHIFKARDLKRLFDRDGYDFENLPFHFHADGYARIRGPKADRMKYPPLICTACNTTRSAPWDRAYDQLTDWFTRNQANYEITTMNLEEVFGARYVEAVDNLRRYCAKSLGCRMVDSGTELGDQFPNPLSGANMELLKIAVCHLQRFRSLEKYQPWTGESALGKGDLLANISKSHLERTGQQKVNNAIWWENIGHYQITHWFNMEINPEFGGELDGSSQMYELIRSELDLRGLNERMAEWLRAH